MITIFQKTIEEKITDKEKVIESLKIRIKSEQRELEELNKEKREVDMKILHEVLQEVKISALDAADVIKEYIENKKNA